MTQVFYRKWRPRRFDQVVGQEAIAQTLRNAVVLGRVAHAYIFCGPRGTGKTSTARILAKAVNCLSPQEGEPDNNCEICSSINEARALDLIEIDAASNRGIDDIRSLRETVHFAPNVARHKVYIVDEAHMLTEYAFNALLKTLEEPPAQAIFVLATTEIHKVPLTIISRCQRFDFKRIPLETAEARLAQLCRDEEIEAAPEALMLIARYSAGSLRDAENVLEQALVSYGSPLSEDQVRDLMELGSDETALELAGHIIRKSVREGLGVIGEVAREGSDLRHLHRGVTEYLRGTLLQKSGAGASLSYPEETREQVTALAEQASLDHIVRALKTFAKVDVRRDSFSTLPLELALVESSLHVEAPAGPALASPTSTPARSPSTGSAPPSVRPGPRPSASSPPVAAPMPEGRRVGPEARPPKPSTGPDAQWSELLRSLSRYKGKRFNLGALLRACGQREIADGVVTLSFSHRSHMERMQEEMEDPATRKVLQEALDKALEGAHEIRVSLIDGQANGPRQSASQRSHLVRAALAMGAQVVGEKEEEHE
jgi:DNA polymerase-3 subunit gamma/tau